MDPEWLNELRSRSRVLNRVFEWAGNGVVGGLALIVVLWAYAHLTTTVSLPLWVFVVVGVLLLVGIAFVIMWMRRRTKIQAKILELVGTDESLLSMIPGYLVNPDRQKAVENLLKEFFRDATHLLGRDVTRCSVLRPDEDKIYLQPWAWFQMGEESLVRSRFYIAPDGREERGVAGHTYLDHIVRVTHMTEQNGKPRGDVFKDVGGNWVKDEGIQYLEASEPNQNLAYRSFVVVPIMATSSNCIGVLCFDSMNRLVFDPANIRQLAVSLAARLTGVIAIHQKLLEGDGQSNDAPQQP
jgi:hypothetical protein